MTVCVRIDLTLCTEYLTFMCCTIFISRYGARDMRFVNYNLHNVREKKARPLDKEPFVEPPMSEESGSIKNDISIHVPVFMEKLDGRYSYCRAKQE